MIAIGCSGRLTGGRGGGKNINVEAACHVYLTQMGTQGPALSPRLGSVDGRAPKADTPPKL